MDEYVVPRQEDAERRMGVVPTDNGKVPEVLFALAMELRPGAMAELNVGRARYDVLCGNGCLDRDETATGTVSPALAP